MMSSDSFQYVVSWNVCVILRSESGHCNQPGTLKISDKTWTIMFKTFLALFKISVLILYYTVLLYTVHMQHSYSVMVYGLKLLQTFSTIITVYVALTCGSMCLHFKLYISVKWQIERLFEAHFHTQSDNYQSCKIATN